MSTAARHPFRFTGWHMLAILLAFFGVVIAVNLAMARLASSTFSGIVVENGYVASQHFNGWLAQAASERTLGWKAEVVRGGDGHLLVRIAGLGAGPARLRGTAQHPLGAIADQHLGFVRQPDGSFRSAAPIGAGRWRVLLEVHAGDKVWHGEAALA